jgi:peptidoglycan/LPS O-acetylase OafA/YrhL
VAQPDSNSIREPGQPGPRWTDFFHRHFPATRLETALLRENNNFDLLRILAAAAVLVGHGYAISPRSGEIDPVQRMIGFDYSGGLAVLVFFFLSGVLVVDSFQRNPDPVHFLVARITRIFPGLAMCLFFSIAVVGTLFTTFSLHDYLASPDTASYYFNNMLLTNLQWRLPGVFAQSNYGLNGSLWTLPTEIRLYAAVALLGVSRLLAFRWLASLVLLGGICTLGFWPTPIPYLTQSHDMRLLSTVFAAGAVCAVNKRLVPLNGLMVYVLWGAAAVCWSGPAKGPVFYGAFIYTCIYLFQLPLVCRWRLPGDYSYGVYIYGFLVQQSVNWLLPGRSPGFNAAISTPVCILFGAVSWHLLEKPCLLWGRKARLPGWKQFSGALHSFYRKGGALTTWLVIINLVPLILSLTAREVPVGKLDYSDLVIQNYGPDNVKAGEIFNRLPSGYAAIWVKASRHISPEAQLVLGGNILPSVVAEDVITAAVPALIYSKPGTLSLSIREPGPDRYRYSKPVDWNVLP